jgi:hypothetical protein
VSDAEKMAKAEKGRKRHFCFFGIRILMSQADASRNRDESPRKTKKQIKPFIENCKTSCQQVQINMLCGDSSSHLIETLQQFIWL